MRRHEDEDGIEGPWTKAMEATTIRTFRRRDGWADSDTVTAGSARRAIAESRRRGGLERPSRVNRGMTHGQALDILERGIADTADEMGIRPEIARNIRREAGAARG